MFETQQNLQKGALQLFLHKQTQTIPETHPVHGKVLKVFSLYIFDRSQTNSNIQHDIQKERALIQQYYLQLQNSLKSENIISNFQTNVSINGSIIIQQNYICTLSQLQYSKISYPRKLQIALSIAQGLKVMHERQICHRNLNPKNISICTNTPKKIIAKINGFNFAVKENMINLNPQKPQITKYTAPEIINQNLYSRDADIWSFGAILFQLLFKDISRIKVGNKCGKVEYPQGAPQWMCNLLSQILERPPSKRHPAGSLVMLVKSAINCSKTTEKYLPNFFEQPKKKIRRTSRYEMMFD